MMQTFEAYPLAVDVGMTNAMCLPPEALALTQDEAEILIADINAFMPELRFELVSASRWKVSFQGFVVKLPRLKKVLNAPVMDCFPTGKDSSQFNAWLTELQMFLKTHAVNARRVAEGKLPVALIAIVKKKHFWL